MAKHTYKCLVCGRPYTYYDASPKWFCSVGCQADSGEIVEGIAELYTGRGRPAKTVRSKKITRLSEIPPVKLGEPDCNTKDKKVIDQSAKILDSMKEKKDS